MPQGQYFDCTQFEPQVAGASAHPIGDNFPARITAVGWKPVRDHASNHYLQIDFATPSGTTNKRLNLRNESEQAVSIAQNELSAICYATGIHRLDLYKDGAELIGAQLQISVRAQKNDPKYTEVYAVFDINGNDPKTIASGRATQAQPQPTPAAVAAQPNNPFAKPAASGPEGWAPGQGGVSSNAAPASKPAWAT
jgi:hypothetical protein